MAVRVGGTTVTEEVHHLVDGLLVRREVVPEHGGIFKVGLRVALLGVDEDGELGGIAQEEDGSVVENPVPVTLLCVKLHGKPTRIPGTVWGTLLATNSREPREHLGLLTHSFEHVDDSLIRDVSIESFYLSQGDRWVSYDVANVVRNLEFTIGASTLGMHNTFGDSFTVKMGEQVDQVEVLKEERSVTANALGSLGVHDRTAGGRGVDGSLIVAVSSWRE